MRLLHAYPALSGRLLTVYEPLETATLLAIVLELAPFWVMTMLTEVGSVLWGNRISTNAGKI